MEVASAEIRVTQGDRLDSEHVSPIPAGSRKDSAPRNRLSLPHRLPAAVWKTRARAVESLRPRRAAQPLEHGAERDDRGRQLCFGRSDWGVLAADDQLAP